MTTQYSPTLVALSVVVAIFASYVALNLAHTVSQTKGRAQAVWLGFGSLAMGIGIWSMHFVGMLAFEMPGMEMAYDVPLMVLSVVVAVGASAIALYVVSRQYVPIAGLVAAGIAMAVAISGMHYIGMFSMRMSARIEWNLFLVVLSIVIALVASFAALFIALRLRDKSDRLLEMLVASTVMGFAISGMHYTGMYAAKFIHDESIQITSENLLVSSGLTMAVLFTTLVILGLALIGSVGERLWSQRERTNRDALSLSEERFRVLVDAVKDYAIFMLDRNANVTTWNRGAERIMGYKASEVIGKHVSMFYPSEVSPETTATELRIAEHDGHFEEEAIRIRKDGTRFWANIAISPAYDSTGTLTGFSKVVRDITRFREADIRMKRVNEELEQRVTERTEELQQREAQLRAIADAVPILIGQLDKNECFLFSNIALADWFARTPAEMYGLSLKEVLGERYEANKPYIDKALSGELATYERLSRSGERSAVLRITFVPQRDSGGKVTGFILVATDVTQYKEIEAELQKAKREAEVASETKSAFLANMSHEIRTPLGAILGFSELMVREEMSPSERVNSVEVIKRNGRLLSNIINDILDLSKVEAGKLEIEKVDVPVTEVLKEVSSILTLEAIEKGIRLKVSSEGMLPSRINTDPIRLRQILLNIIGNAIKFTTRGSVDVKVKLIPSPSGSNKLAFVVKDTGEGISQEHAAKLFTPFTQADVSTTRRFGGTGLGLALSKKLANALGGDVVLTQSEPGKGSTFTVTIDPGQSERILFESSDYRGENIISIGEPQVNLKQMKVLVVDDSSDNQALIKKLLRLAGADVETANNGKEGVQKALDGNYHLVLMDLQMPEMDGYEATRQLRARGYQKPIIALTAHAMKEERKRCLESGFNDHLTKPIDRHSLLKALAEYPA